MGVNEIKKQKSASSGGKQLLKNLVFCLHKHPVSGMVWYHPAISPFSPNLTISLLRWFVFVLFVDQCRCKIHVHDLLSEIDYNHSEVIYNFSSQKDKKRCNHIIKCSLEEK